jgi:hypothetical protein
LLVEEEKVEVSTDQQLFETSTFIEEEKPKKRSKFSAFAAGVVNFFSPRAAQP